MSPMARSALAPNATPPDLIRNFCIIAHIDHGKSTLADRMLQLTGVVDSRAMRAQYLDRMDIERERGITIKSQAVRMPWELDGTTYALNMIDTPATSTSPTRCPARSQPARARCSSSTPRRASRRRRWPTSTSRWRTTSPSCRCSTRSTCRRPAEKYAEELAKLIGCEPEDCLKVSGKTGAGVEPLLDTIVRDLPAPVGDPSAPARAMIFDSVYDTYRGVVTYVRVVDGNLSPREKIVMMSTRATHELLEIGVISPEPVPSKGSASVRSATSSPASRTCASRASATR